jgi:adhesin transport system membrane fusion protein
MDKNKKEPKIHPDHEDYVSDKKAAFLNKSTFLANSVIYIILLLIIVGTIWAYFSKIDQVTVGLGKVIPFSEGKIIQSLDGGIIEKIYVKEGDVVDENQQLIKLDETRYKSDYLSAYSKFLALTAMSARLQAEADGKDHIDVPQLLKDQEPILVTRETNLFKERREDFNKQVALLEQSTNIAKKEFEMYEKVVKEGVVSMLDFYRAQRTVNELQEKLYEKQSAFREAALTELNQRKAELSSVSEQLNSLRDKMTRTVLVSPVKGVVKKINITTIGGVVSPGMDIMEIVPISDPLLIEARVQPKDIAFIQVGQPATVKIGAYDYTIYGSLYGKVIYVSADTIEPQKTRAEEGAEGEKSAQVYYIVKVKTDHNYLGTEQHPYPISPGMTATVHIQTGKKSIFSYILKPILKAKDEALRER